MKRTARQWMAACAAMVLCVCAARAGTVTWNGSTDMNWSQPDSTSWSGSTYNSGDTAQFDGAGTGTITVGAGGVTPGPVNITSGNYTFSGGSIGGTGAATKSGAGTLTLSGANTYSGGTTISGGKIIVSNGSALGTNTVTLDGGELDVSTVSGSGTIANAIVVNSGGGTINASGNKYLNGSITGSGALSVKGGNYLRMKDCTGYNGAMTITGDALFQSAGTNGNVGAAYTVNATALIIDYQTGLNAIFNMGSLAGSGKIYGSGWNQDGVTIKTLSVGGLNTDTTFSGVLANEISGTTAKLALTKIGTGTLTLAGTNTYSGGTTISNGTLVLANRLALTNSTVTVGVTNGLAFSNDTSFVLGGLGGSYPFGLTNTANTAVALTIGANNAASVYSGAMGGGGSLTKSGAGTLTLSGTNTYSGGTTISGGKIAVSNGSALGNGTVTIDGGELDVSTVPYGGTITNAIAVNSGGGTINASSSSKVVMGSITGSGALSVKGSSTGYLWMKDCTGYNGAMTITGSALFQSTGTNGNAGAAYTVNATTLIIDYQTSRNTIFNMGSLAGSGKIYGSGYNQDGGTIKTLSVGGLNADTTFSGVLADVIDSGTTKLALTKIGTGAFTLTGTNTYSGGTTISNGTLLVNGSVTGAVKVAGGILGGTGKVDGTVTNHAALTAAGTNSIGTLTVANLVLAENSMIVWNYDAASQDLIAVTGMLTLPNVTTVNVSMVSEGLQPAVSTLCTFGSGPAAGKLANWVVTGAQPGSYATVSGNKVLLIKPTGTLIRFF